MAARMLSLALMATLLAAANACSFYSMSVQRVADPPLPELNTSYSAEDVHAALNGLGTWTNRYVDPSKTMFSCVDSRASTSLHQVFPTMETAGGDMSELVALIIAYHRIKGTNVTEESVSNIFNSFMSRVATTKRPFYYHTADDKLTKAIEHFIAATGVHTVVVPMREPENETLAAAWYEALSSTDAQGCGHIRYMMTYPDQYDLKNPGEVSTLPWAIKAFYRYWWRTADGSTQRRKVFQPILQGTLAAKALAIVNNEGPGCPGLEPDLAPFHGGSTMFLYQANAINVLRTNVLIPFIQRYDRNVDSAAVLAELQSLQAIHLAAVLRLLPPLNSVPTYQVNITTTYV